jgi:quinol monooxygenase YgiN
MIVVYATLDVGSEDRAGYDAWFAPLAEVARGEQGCVAYDLLTDARFPNRRTIFEAWETVEDLMAHGEHPVHAEMLTVGRERWGVKNFKVHMWTRADGHRYSEQDQYG